MKRFRPAILALPAVLAMAAYALPVGAAAAANSPAAATRGKADFHGYQEPLCTSRASLCADAYDNPAGEYVGHDEPSVEFKSNVPGSGNDITYTMTLPTEPAKPSPPRAGPRRDVELPAPADVLVRPDAVRQRVRAGVHEEVHAGLRRQRPRRHEPRRRANYIGKHPGNAYMELQFYGPGYVPQFEGFGCTARQYCAAMTIDSRTLDQNTGIENTDACDNYVLGGPEPINWAYITKSGSLAGAGEPAVHRARSRARTSAPSTRTSPRTC